MADVTRAEAQRRVREWLRIDFDDPKQTDAFEDAKRALSTGETRDLAALIAVGEFRAARALLAAVPEPRSFLELFGLYFAASADDAFARASWPRVVAMVREMDPDTDSAMLRHLVMAAEAIGDGALAAEFKERVSAAPSSRAERLDAISATVYRLLGYAPDAPKGRLLLRPEIHPEWSRLEVQNIHIGDALIALRYSRIDNRMDFEFAQVTGAYPIRLIFEPILSSRVGKAFVDGTPASLDFRPLGERFVIPVQIMLDDRRTVRFE